MLARLVGPEGVGYVSVTLRTFAVFAVLASMSSSTTVAYLAAKSGTHDEASRTLRDALVVCIPISVVGSLALIWLAPLLASGLGFPILQFLLVIIALSLPAETVLLIAVNLLRGLHRFGVYAAGLAVVPVTWLLLNVSFGLTGTLTVEQAILNNTMAAFAAMGMGMLLVRRYWRCGPSENSLRSQYFTLGLPLTVVAMLFSMIEAFGPLAIALFGGSADSVGVYSNAYSLAAYLRLLAEPVSVAALPLVTSYFAHSEAGESVIATRVGVGAVLALLTPVCVVIAVISQEILLILYPAAFLPGAVALSIVAIAMPAFGVYALLNKVMIAYGHTGDLVKVLVIGTIVDVAVTVILVPVVGILGAALAASGAFFSMAVSSMRFSAEFGVSVSAGPRVLRSALITFACCYIARTVLATYFEFQSISTSLAIAAAVLAVALLAQIASKPLQHSEAEFIIQIVDHWLGTRSRLYARRVLLLLAHEDKEKPAADK